jgi:Post-segregation antitoxin CcdA
MRMARVNITVPDDLLGRARAAGLNVSRLAASALAEELDRRGRVAELDAYLAEMEVQYGPVAAEDLAAAAAWVDRIAPATAQASARAKAVTEPGVSRSARRPRSA